MPCWLSKGGACYLTRNLWPVGCYVQGTIPWVISWMQSLALTQVGQALLMEGVVRRIGDGAETRIWDTPWLADPHDPRLHTLCIADLEHATVSGLLDHSGTWDEDVVKDLFVATDVPSILATPVSPTSRYVWLWQGDVRGIYTVRHGYNLLTSASIHANPQVHFVEWRKLWKLPVPPKVKNLLWRCMWNILPVRVLLRNRHVWAEGQGSSVQHSDCLAVLLNTALCNPSVKDSVHIAAKLWLVWNARNDAVWKGKFLRVDDLLRQVESLRDLWVSDYSRDVVVTAVALGATSWSPLPIHRLKCNVDATLFEDGVGYGLVVRSHTGAFVSAHNARLDCGRDPYLAGAMAVKEALSSMKINGYSDFILESDSLNLCSSYNSNLVNLSYYTLQEKSRFATENRDRNNFVAI
nr:uncharacterized protein LOC109192125 [Ipomoea batatas]